MWQKSKEADILFAKVVFILFEHQCYPFQNSSLGQLQTDEDVAPTFGSSTENLQPVWSSACPLHSFEWFFIKMSLKGSEKGSFTWDQTSQTNGCSIMTTPHVALPFPSRNFWPHKAFLWFSSLPIYLTSSPVTFSLFLFPKLKNVLKWRQFGTLENTTLIFTTKCI